MANILQIIRDPKDQLGFGKGVVVNTIDENGQIVASTSGIYLVIDDIQSDGKSRTARFHLLQWNTPPPDCKKMQAYVLMTDPESAQ